MRSLHPSFGPVPPAVFVEAQSLPFGLATLKLRKFVPTFGRGNGELIKFKIEVSREIIQEQRATVVIEAEDEEQAKELLSKAPDDEFHWEDDGSEDERSFRVTRIEAAS